MSGAYPDKKDIPMTASDAVADAATSRIDGKRLLLLGLLLSVLAAVCYWSVGNNGFIGYDDPVYVLENRHVKSGLTLDGVAWAFTSSHASNWHPLTWLSLMLDDDLYGTNPAGYHITSAILHGLAGLVLFAALCGMTGKLWASFFTAALFLVHPLHVESVAWVAERKDVLSGLFWMLGLWGYGRYARRRTWRRYGAVLLFFVAALLSKPMAVTFPFVLLLMDFWPLKRMEGGIGRAIVPLVAEKIPFFAFSAAASIVTFLVQKDWSAVASLSVMPLGERLLHAPVVYAAYLKMAFWPLSLSAFYPYHGLAEAWKIALAIVLLAAVTLAALRWRKSHPWLLSGWLWYLGTLVPVIGLVKVGSQAMADRYTYLPLVGIFMMAAFGGAALIERLRVSRVLAGTLLMAILAALSVLTVERVGKWKDSATLFSDAIAHTKDNYLAYYMLGMARVQERDIGAAIGLYREAVRIRPAFVQAQNSLGHLLMVQGKTAEAADCFEKALRIHPGFVPALKNLAHLRMQQGLTDQAISYYRQALGDESEDPELYNNLGVALFLKGDRDGAARNIREAIRIKPDYREARENLARILKN